MDLIILLFLASLVLLSVFIIRKEYKTGNKRKFMILSASVLGTYFTSIILGTLYLSFV